MNKSKTLYIVGNITLPNVDAGATRVLELSKGFKPYFDNIVIAGKYNKDPHNLYDYDEKIKFLPYHLDKTKNVIDKINLIFRPKKLIINDLKKCYEEFDITHILIYSALEVRAAKRIRKFAKKNNINILFDVVEFQTLSNQTLSSFFTFYLMNVYTNKHLIKRGDNVISISSFLNSYFLSRGCNSVTIPFVFDTKSINYDDKKDYNDHLNLMYAGSPKKRKDLLVNSIEGLYLLPEDARKKVRYQIAGISKDSFVKEYRGIAKKIDFNDGVLKFYNHISKDDVKKLYNQSDFSILIRDSMNRISKAGFPTKVSESLAHGVPVICNLTSDLSDFLKGDYNSLLMINDSPEEFARCVALALQKNHSELIELRKNARNTSVEKLDINLFDSSIRKVLKLERIK